MRHRWIFLILPFLLLSFISVSISQVPVFDQKAGKTAVPSKTRADRRVVSSYTYQAKQSGNWNDSTTWRYESYTGGWTPPSSSDYVDIGSDYTVTVTESITVGHLTVEGQLSVAAGQTLTVVGGGETGGLTLDGTLLIQGALDVSGGTVYAYWGSTVIYGGSVPQTVAPITYYNLTISNPAGADLAAATEVDGSVTVSQGNLRTGSNTLTLDSYNGSITEAAPFEVLGMLYTARACTLGRNESFGGMGVEISRSGGSSVVMFEVTRYTGSAPSIPSANAVLRSFDISPAVNTGNNATLVFHYAVGELNGADESALVLYKSSGGSGWTKVGGSVNTSSHSISVGGIDSFSSWAAAAPLPVPTITSISPATGIRGSGLSMSILGTNFAPGGTSVSFYPSDITVNSVTVSSPAQLSANVSVSTSAPTGFRDVMVTNSYGTAVYSNGFQVQNPAPTIASISFAFGVPSQSLADTVRGAGFLSGTTTVSFGTGISVGSVSVSDDHILIAQLAISSGAAAGSRNVVVSNPAPGGGTATLTGAFSVIPAPTLTSVLPGSGVRGQGLIVLLNGSNFVSGATSVNFGSGITSDSVSVVSSSQVRSYITISLAASTGARDVSLSNSGPTGSVTLAGGFTVLNPAPTIASIVPATGARGKLVSVTINGSGFVPGVTNALPVAGLTLTSVTFVSTTQITGSFLIARDAALGPRDMTITNSGPGGGSATLVGAFAVQNPSPTVLSASPNAGNAGQGLSVVVTGTDFISGVSGVDFGVGITVGAAAVDSSGTHLTAAITIATTATAGSRNVTVTNSGPGGGSSALINAFTVANLAPTLTSLSTYSAGRGQTLDVTMTGTNFSAAATTATFGVNITVNSLTISSTTSAIANITVAPTAIIGARSVSVTNAPPGGGTATLMSVFNVGNPTPTLSAITPSSGTRGQALDVVITGTGFVSGTSTLTLGSDITVNLFTVTSSTQINANIGIAFGCAAKGCDVTVTNGPPGGGSGLLAAGFTVNNPLPIVSSVSPSSANRGSIVNVTVAGSQYITGVTSMSFGADIVVNSFVVNSPIWIIANITVSPAAASGSRTVTVTNAGPGGGSASLPAGFTVGTGTATSVDGDLGVVPDQFVLQEAYPNPFNPSTRIRYGVPEDSRVRIVVHNLLGNIVAELVNGERTKGTYELQWHADNLPSGVYLIRMIAESMESTKGYVSSRKVILMK